MYIQKHKSRKRFFIKITGIALLFAVGILVIRLLPSRATSIEYEMQDLTVDSVDETLNNTIDLDKDFIDSAEIKTDAYCCLPDFTDTKNLFILNKTSFLELNVDEMQVRAYEKGILQKQVAVLMVGNPSGWGGTASGIYKIESGNEAAFSGITEVYMPFALKFYGKYYMHGEPYYKDGSKSVAENSGGCLRLKDADAEYMYQFAEINMPTLVIDKQNDDYEYDDSSITPFPLVSADAFLVADLGSGYVFAEKNSDKVHQIASITKLMTAIVVSENVDLRKKVTITKKIFNQGYGATDVLIENTRMRVVELFYPLLIESSNDSAFALLGFLGKEKTIRLMNEKAKSILMPNTKFTDPSGYDPSNVSTAKDLYYLARYILNNRPPLFSISRGDLVQTFGKMGFYINDLWNKNVFSEDETFIGGKTGYITTSGYNGVFVFRFKDAADQNRNVVIITLGSICQQCQKQDVQKIYIWLMENYFPNTLK